MHSTETRTGSLSWCCGGPLPFLFIFKWRLARYSSHWHTSRENPREGSHSSQNSLSVQPSPSQRRPSRLRVSFMLIQRFDYTTGLDVKTQNLAMSLICFHHTFFTTTASTASQSLNTLFLGVVALGTSSTTYHFTTRLSFWLGPKRQHVSGSFFTIHSCFLFTSHVCFADDVSMIAFFSCRTLSEENGQEATFPNCDFPQQFLHAKA